MNNNQPGRPIIHESSFEIALAREYLTGNLDYKALAKKYGIEEYHALRHFIRGCKKHYPQDTSVPEKEDKAADTSSGRQR